MKELTKEQLAQEIKEQKRTIHLIFLNDLLDKMQYLAEQTMRVDYEPSYKEAIKIQRIKTYADIILKNIS